MRTDQSKAVVAAVLHGVQDIRLETRQLVAPGPGEVQIQVKATGLCGSDLHYFTHFRNGAFQVKTPLVLGHESSGIIVSAHPSTLTKYPHLKPGTKVAIEAGLPCRKCERCREGRYNLCAALEFGSSAKSFPHRDGSLSEYINHPAEMVHVLPSNVSLTLGALVEPLSVILHASNRLQLQPGSTVLVFGAGTVGLLACALSRSLGCSKVVIADVDRNRIQFAEKTGWCDVALVPPMRMRDPGVPVDMEADAEWSKEVAGKLKEQAAGVVGEAIDTSQGFDYVFECTGHYSCVQMSIHCARTGGKIALVGMGGAPNMLLPVSAAALREVDIIGVFRYTSNVYPNAIRLLSGSEKLREIEKVVTQRVGLGHVQDAFKSMVRMHDESGFPVVKILIES